MSESSWPVVVAVLVPGVVALAAVLGWIYRTWRGTFGRRAMVRGKVERLCANCNVAVYESLLGPATIRRTKVDEESGVAYGERIYVDPFCYVQAVTDDDDRVVRFAVTVRSFNFKPRFRILDWVDLRIGKDTFAAAVSGEPVKVDPFIGANWAVYREVHHRGRPGRYQEVYLAATQAGAGEALFSAELGQLAKEKHEGLGAQQPLATLAPFRQRQCPNTYGETSPGHGFFSDPFEAGPEYTDVRVLRPEAARPWREKWSPLGLGRRVLGWPTRLLRRGAKAS